MKLFDVPISGLFFSSHDIRTYSLLVTSPGLFQCMWITHYHKGTEDHPPVSALVFVSLSKGTIRGWFPMFLYVSLLAHIISQMAIGKIESLKSKVE